MARWHDYFVQQSLTKPSYWVLNWKTIRCTSQKEEMKDNQICCNNLCVSIYLRSTLGISTYRSSMFTDLHKVGHGVLQQMKVYQPLNIQRLQEET